MVPLGPRRTRIAAFDPDAPLFERRFRVGRGSDQIPDPH